VLKYCVDNMGLKNVRTQLFNGKAPGMRILSNASALVQDALTDHKSYDPYTLDRLKQIDA
jgi:hypothetical protein